MDFTRLRAGSIRATLVDHKRKLVIEQDGRPVGAVHIKGMDPPFSTVAESADGAWAVNPMEVTQMRGPARWVVTDPGGNQVAQMAAGRSEQVIDLPSGSVTWSHHRRKPQYRVDGLFSASRGGAHRLVPGFSGHPFAGEATPELVARPDALLILLLAAWRTHDHIANQVLRDS